MKTGKKILLILLGVFVVMQFFRITKTNAPVVASNDFITITNPNTEIRTLLESACYDCHSNQTRYPWYAEVAPVSWWLQDHVNEGKEHLNFSVWGTYSDKRADHKLEECAEEVEHAEMPLNSYTWTHSDAKLTAEQRELLEDFFNALRK